MPNADLVVHVGVGQRDVRHDEVRDREALDHLRDDQRADVAIGSHRLIAELLENGLVDALPEGVEVDLRRHVGLRARRRLAAERHHHEGDLVEHGTTLVPRRAPRAVLALLLTPGARRATV